MTLTKPSISALSLVALLLAPAAKANLVTNGGFETGNLTGWNYTIAASGPNLEVVSGAAHTGTWHLRFGATGSTDDAVSQTLATVAGATYSISFWFQAETDAGTPNNHFAFNWDGGAAELDLTDAANSAYTQYNYSLVATSSATMISFGGRNGPFFSRLDDISVTQSAAPTIPEPGSLALVALAALAAIGARRHRRVVPTSQR